MDTTWRTAVWGQFGAAIDTLENTIRACPDELWGDRLRRPEYWYLVYHTLFFLDYYLSESPVGFLPPDPFTLSELDPSGVLPDRVYSKEELLAYLAHGREKCRATVATLTDQKAGRPCGFNALDGTVAELMLYNLRHVQHHSAQLNLILRQTIDSATPWVDKASTPLTAPSVPSATS